MITAQLTVYYEESQKSSQEGPHAGGSGSSTQTLDAFILLEIPNIDYRKGTDAPVSFSYGSSGIPGAVMDMHTASGSVTREIKILSFTGQASRQGEGQGWEACHGPKAKAGKKTWTGSHQGSGSIQAEGASFSFGFKGDQWVHPLRVSSGPFTVIGQRRSENPCEGTTHRSTTPPQPQAVAVDAPFHRPGPGWTMQLTPTANGYTGTARYHARTIGGETEKRAHEITRTVRFTLEIGAAQTTIKIVKPEPDSKHIFGSKVLTVLELEAQAKVEPAKYAPEVEWFVEDIQGSNKTIKPAKGDKVIIRFERLPEKNDQFTPKTIMAKVRGKQDQVTIKVFFDRNKKDNPGGKEPNWFYYWRQTSAAQGHADAIRYDPACKAQREEGYTWGYFAGYIPDNPDTDHIYICDLSKNNFTVRNPIRGKTYEGIDGFGVVVRHEWSHKVYFEDWWGRNGRYRQGFDEQSRTTRDSYDIDHDRIPDAVEEGPYSSTHPLKRDTRGLGYLDEEYLAFDNMDNWAVGSADKEDWACAGKQCEDR